ncbi:MAG: DUF192 domain-containing protein [Gammaproteobacteria bacterium]|nr:DUF192 domain-containing protein [Gammaproteobacteria bacterium]
MPRPPPRLTDPARRLAVPLLALAALGIPLGGEACEALPEAHLSASLGGTLTAELDWQGDVLECSGMPRPDQAGGRLQFRGPLPGGGRLGVVIGLEGLAPGVTAQELPANVTLVIEPEGRFFSTRQQTGCWADVEGNVALADGGYRVSGQLWCVRGLAEVGGEGSVSVPQLAFTGLFAADDEEADAAPAIAPAVAGAPPEPARRSPRSSAPPSGPVAALEGRFERSSLLVEATEAGMCYHFEAYMARNERQRMRGLMFIEAMPRHTGMIFWNPRGQQPSMWMRNTLIPLDMLFLENAGTLVHVAADTVPGSLEAITSPAPARWVLELNGGVAEALGIRPGDRVRHAWFDRDWPLELSAPQQR